MKKIFLSFSFSIILLTQSPALATEELGIIVEPTGEPMLETLPSPTIIEHAPVQPVSSKNSAPLELSIIRETWFLRKNLLSAGMEEEARNALEKLYQERLNFSLENLTLYASALIREGLQYAREGNLSRAIELIKFSQKLAPDFPPAYFFLARIYLTANKFNPARIITQYLEGCAAIGRNFLWGVNLVSNSALIFFGSIFLSFAIYGFILLLKYLKLFLHDFSDLFPQAVPSSLTAILGILVVLAPLLFFQKGAILMLIWALLITVVYSSTREKALTIIFFLLLGLSPFLLNTISTLLTSPHTGIVTEIAQANRDEWTLNTEERLKEWLQEHPQDIEVLFTLGILNKRKGNYEMAKQYYQKTIELDPKFAPSYNNLANVFLATEELNQASRHYKRAQELDPSMVSARYNLAQFYYKQALLTEGERELGLAKRLNSDRVSDYTSIYSSTNINRLVIDELIPSSAIWRKLFSSSSSPYPVMELPGGHFLNGWELKKMSLVGLILILFSLFLISLTKKMGFSRVCGRCGKPLCQRCQPVISEQSGIQEEGLCPQCYYTYIKHGGVEPGVRAKKELQVQRFQARSEILQRLFSLLLLGTGHLIKGFTLRGIALLIIFIAFILNFYFWDGLLRNNPPVDASISLPRLIISLLLFLTIYGLGIRDIYRKE
ncbi:MAG: tetratricopeptide repeat protein [Deltaproteobacteria bacterium]|nr:MAG: tetratricopeptide repeat protein [Deltaproteobacteria bacterium]